MKSFFGNFLRFLCPEKGRARGRRKKDIRKPKNLLFVIFFNRTDPQITCFYIHVSFLAPTKKGIVPFKTFSHCTANNLLSCFCFLFFFFFYTNQPLSTLSRRINLFLVPSYTSFFVCTHFCLFLIENERSRLHPPTPHYFSLPLLFLTFYVKM